MITKTKTSCSISVDRRRFSMALASAGFRRPASRWGDHLVADRDIRPCYPLADDVPSTRTTISSGQRQRDDCGGHRDMHQRACSTAVAIRSRRLVELWHADAKAIIFTHRRGAQPGVRCQLRRLRPVPHRLDGAVQISNRQGGSLQRAHAPLSLGRHVAGAAGAIDDPDLLE